MRKKKKEITTAPVETDFYREALKAFDVVLPPSEEELETMRQAEEEKANKRRKRIRGAILTAAIVVVAVLALWRPWENRSGPPDPSEPSVSTPVPDPIWIGFHVYPVSGYTSGTLVGFTGMREFSESKLDRLPQRLEDLDWIDMRVISISPAPAIGDLVIDRGDGEKQITFNANGLLFAEGYMARPDDALWNDLIKLLQTVGGTMDPGSFVTQLLDGSTIYLDIRADGSFAAQKDQFVLCNGFWGRVAEYLLLYADDPTAGMALFRIGNDGSLSYCGNHVLSLLTDLKAAGPLYPTTEAGDTTVSMAVNMLWPGTSSVHYGISDLNQEQYRQLNDMLEQAQWTDMSTSGYMPEFCGSVRVVSQQNTVLIQTISLQFSYTGLIYDGLRYCSLSDEAWMDFVKILSSAMDLDMRFRSYTYEAEEDSLHLIFGMDGTFYLQVNGGSVTGNYLQFGNVVLLAGPDGVREILFWDRVSGNLQFPTGDVMTQIPMVYGDADLLK